jgi:hypothetical protein
MEFPLVGALLLSVLVVCFEFNMESWMPCLTMLFVLSGPRGTFPVAKFCFDSLWKWPSRLTTLLTFVTAFSFPLYYMMWKFAGASSMIATALVLGPAVLDFLNFVVQHSGPWWYWLMYLSILLNFLAIGPMKTRLQKCHAMQRRQAFKHILGRYPYMMYHLCYICMWHLCLTYITHTIMPEMAWNLSGEGRLDKAINALSMLKNFIYTLGKHGPFMAAKVFVVFRTQGEPQNHTIHLTYERSLGALCLCGFVPLVLDIVCYEIVVCLQASISQDLLPERS